MSSASAPPRPSSAGSAAAGADAKQSTSVPACASSSPLFADAPAVAETAVKRSEITAEEKLRVLAWHHANGCNQRRTAAHFQAQEPKFGRLNQGTVSRWLLSENKFKAQVRSHQPTVIRAKSVRHPQVERCLALWLDRMPLDQYYTLTGKKVKSMVRRLYEFLEVPTVEWLELSNGWLSRFQARHGLKLQRAQGDADTSAESCLEAERARLQAAVKQFVAAGEGRTLNDVWNMDETSFFLDCSPVVTEDEDMEVGILERVGKRLTVMLAANATGSERLEPIFIGHKGQDAVAQMDHGNYYANATAWTTSEIFCQWLQTWNQELIRSGRHILLLVDKSRAHMDSVPGLTNVQLEFVSPFLTNFVQPCCIGLVDIFHANYRRSVVERALNVLKTRGNGDGLFTVDQLEAMNLAKAAWLTVEVGAIEACWVQAQVLSNEMVDEGRWSEVVHSSIHVDNLLLVNPLQELQESLNALASESHKSQKNLVLHNAGDFVKLDLQNALGTSLSVPEIVTLARMDVGNSVHSSNDSTTTTITTCITGGKGADSTVHYLPSAELPGTNMALPQPSWMDPNDVLNSLLIMESHWRATEMELPSEVLDLLVLTRENLQQEFASRQN